MRPSIIRRIPWLAAAAVVVAGCATLGRELFKQPVVQLRDVRVTGIGLTGANLDVVLGVYNPNGYRLDATALQYRVYVDTVDVADGTLTTRNAFPGGDTTVVHLPVHFTYTGISAAGRELTRSGAVDYRVIGDITVGSPLGNRTFPFSSKGRFNTLDAGIH